MSDETFAPRRNTFAQNLIFTVRLFVVVSILGLAIWGLDVWTSGR